MYLGSLKQNQMSRLSEGAGLSMEKSTITFFNSSMAREIYGDGSVLDAVRSSLSSKIRCNLLSANSFHFDLSFG